VNIVWGVENTLHSSCGSESKKVVQWDVWKNVNVSGPNMGLTGHIESIITTKDGIIFPNVLDEWFLVEN